MEPLVTVNILSYNRKDDLRATLHEVFAQNYKNIEVIVVDNDSTDGSAEMVKSEFSGVRVIELKRNIGIAGWNEGFRIARGEFILVLDDDSYPEPDALTIAMKRIVEDDHCVVVAMVVYSHKSRKFDRPVSREGRVVSFTGCGALLRKSIFDRIGMFSKALFLYQHEIEFSLRIYSAGYFIAEEEGAVVHHLMSSSHRVVHGMQNIDARRLFYDNRNTIYILMKHFPYRTILPRICRIILGRLYLGVRERCFLLSLKGLIQGIMLSLPTFFSKNNVSVETQVLYGNGSFAGGFFFWNEVYSYGNKRPAWLGPQR